MNEEAQAAEHEAQVITVNQHPAAVDPVATDIQIRLGIINVLHSAQAMDEKHEAVRSLRNAYPRYFRDDS